MSWNNVSKPIGPTYTNLNPIGKQQYDQADIEYDSADTFYDGLDPNQWTDISKPNTSWTKINKPV